MPNKLAFTSGLLMGLGISGLANTYFNQDKPVSPGLREIQNPQSERNQTFYIPSKPSNLNYDSSRTLTESSRQYNAP